MYTYFKTLLKITTGMVSQNPNLYLFKMNYLIIIIFVQIQTAKSTHRVD